MKVEIVEKPLFPVSRAHQHDDDAEAKSLQHMYVEGFYESVKKRYGSSCKCSLSNMYAAIKFAPHIA